MNLAEYIGKFRHDRSLSQHDMAEKIGISQPYYGKVENGHRRIDLDLVDKWTAGLGLDEVEAAEFRRLALADYSQPLAQELDDLRRAGSLVIALRLHQAQLHVERSGRPLDIKALEATGLDPWDLRKATVTGAGSPAAMKAVAKALGVTVGWILMGMDDPPWYREAMGTMTLPNDAAWSAERARLGLTH